MAPHVSDHDRRAMARQAAASAHAELDVEPSGAEATQRRDELDRWRRAHGLPPLQEWWEDKPELELHERARALGLLA